MTDPRPLHRLFGLAWIDFFRGTGVEVETEVDLSLRQQFLDVILIRKHPGPVPRPLPDGFESLAEYNLVTFKSHHEALDAWALCELVGHYVNYRKQSSHALDGLLPEGDYRLFAVCARFPQKLAQATPLTLLREGVYEVRVLELPIRVVVSSQLPQADQNAMLHLFSARQELLRYGQEHYRPRSAETSSLLFDLFTTYGEDPTCPTSSRSSSARPVRRSCEVRHWKNGSTGCRRANGSRDCLRKRCYARFPPRRWKRWLDNSKRMPRPPSAATT